MRFDRSYAAGFVFAAMLGLLVAAGPLKAEEPFSEKVDRLIEAACQRDKVPIAAPADDAEFVRRVYLDLAGVVPTAAQARAFLEDSAAGKHDRLVDHLVVSPEFFLQMARAFDVMLVERRIATIPSYDFKPEEWQEWLAESFRKDLRWDRLATTLLGSDGSDPSSAAAARFYLVRDVEPHLVARDIGRLILGMDLQCAQCHDDPRIKAYDQAGYYGLFAFVNRLKHFRDDKNKKNFVSEKANGDVSFSSAFSGAMGMTNPRLPGGEMIADPKLAKDRQYKVKPEKETMGVPAYSRRSRLAELLPRRQTPGFSRNAANRLWAYLLGRGLVHPLDMHHPENPPSHPELLDLLSRRLESTGYDIRGLLRDIARTRVYRRSSRLPEGLETAPAADRFAVAALRPLSPEQLGWSVLQVAGRLPSRIERTRRRMKDAAKKSAAQKQAKSAEADRAETIDLAWQAHKKAYGELRKELQPLFTVFSRLPGQPDNGFQPSVDQALFLLNSEQMIKFMKESELLNRLARIENPDELANTLFLSVVSRRATEAERQEVAKLIEGLDDSKRRREVVRRIVWGQLVTAEFRLNH